MWAEIGAQVGKQRHGPIGTIALSFQPNLTKFGNWVEKDYGQGGGAF